MKHHFEVLVKNGALVIYDWQNDCSAWQLSLSELNVTRPINGRQASHWVLYLSTRPWAHPEMLYKVAAIIASHFPTEDIDWQATFFIIEEKDFYNTVASLHRQFHHTIELPRKKQILVMEYGDDEDEVRTQLTAVVDQKLKEFKII